MAQALFDDHPIEHYLRESGEVPERIPGGLDEFSRDPTYDNVHNNTVLQEWLRQLINTTKFILEYTGLRGPSASSEFAERFKYIVISSPLLSSSLSTSPTNRAPTPTTPGHYDQPISLPPITTATTTSNIAASLSHTFVFVLACLVPASMAHGYYLTGLIFLGVVKLLLDQGLDFSSFSKPVEDTWTSTLDSLGALVTANNTWDNVVNESLGVLEAEEQTGFHSFPPSSSSQALRIALSSSLHTTQTQCDNVRQLLAALTSPIVLSQLSHMYAPPAPSHITANSRGKRPISLLVPSPSLSEPKSQEHPITTTSPPDDMYSRSRASMKPQTSTAAKRTTWNGSYMSLAGGPSPRRMRRRSNLSTIVSLEELKSPNTPVFTPSSNSTIVPTPPSTPTIPEDGSGDADADAEDEPFGVAALGMQRRRRSARVSIFTTPSPPSSNIPFPSSSSSSSLLSGQQGSPLTSSIGSRFTSFSSPSPSSSRHSHSQTLSFSNLHFALQGALGSKRFACSHLLALRFSDPSARTHRRLGSNQSTDTESEDESYWEDVRSVISLLTSTLEDASARLTEALADTVQRQEQERYVLTDEESSTESLSLSAEPVESRRSSTVAPLSYAPMPSQTTRFAAHVDAITSALDDARDHLRQCVASLREEMEYVSKAKSDPDAPSPALESYDRLRRELGLAFRECERGRGTLMEVVRPRVPDPTAEEEGDEESRTRHDEQFSSGESDKTLFNAEEAHDLKLLPREQKQDQNPGHDPLQEDRDDATAHLIATASAKHLPPPGIEEVFESMAAAQPYVRERSKLTREERIRLAKARRESAFSPLEPVNEGMPRLSREGWGPGGDVVQELKDVIWKVGEERRKMVEWSSNIGHRSDVSPPPPL